MLKSRLDNDKYLSFVIMKETIFWNKGNPEMCHKVLLPGYVIIKTKCSIEEILQDVRSIVFNPKNNIYKLLSYGNDNKNIMLCKSEQRAWESLLDSDFFIRASFGVIDGGQKPSFDTDDKVKGFDKTITIDKVSDSVSNKVKPEGKLKITSGPLVGKEAYIKKINRYKRRAILDVEFAGEFIEIPLVLHLLAKDKENMGGGA